MQTATFLSTPKIVAGIGVIDSLGAQLAGFGEKPLLLIGSQSLRKNGTLARLESVINGEYTLFENIASDPDIEIVEAGAAAYQKNHCDYLIAVGGGSVLDAAKAIGLLATSGGKIEDYETKAPTRPLPPLVAIPTTAGTGSEVTKFSIITDTKRKKKMALGHEYLMPSMAVLDPNLTVSMPRHVTAATGMDALTHAIEAYISDKASVMTDIWALKAIELITKNLSIAVYDPENLAARLNMLYGQLFAGIAFNNSSVALVHAMSRPLGAYYGIAHGQANAMLLPAVMKYNQKVCAVRYQNIAGAMEILSPAKNVAQTADDVVNFVADLFNDLPLKRRLSEFDVAQEDLAKMAHDAYVNGSAKVNPRKALQEEVIAIYRSIY